MNSEKEVAVQSVREWGQPDVPEYGDIYTTGGVLPTCFSLEIVIYALFDCA